MEKDKKNAFLNHKTFEQIIKESGLTQEEYAEEIGITDRYIRDLKTKDTNISVSLAYNISNQANCSIESILTASEETSESNKYLQYKAQNTEIFHSLKNDLQTIFSMAQVLRLKCQKMGIDTNIVETIILEIKQTIIQLNELLQQNFVDTQPYQTTLNQIILNWTDAQRPKLNLYNIQLETRLAAGLPKITLNEQRIQQVLSNCIDNSLVSILEQKPSTGKILITTQLDKNKNQILLKIIDNGVGLTPEQQANFFKPHYTTKAGGTGLGATLTQAVVKMYGGNISVNGAPGQGCCVCISLPLQIGKSFSNEDFYTEVADMLF